MFLLNLNDVDTLTFKDESVYFKKDGNIMRYRDLDGLKTIAKNNAVIEKYFFNIY